MANVEAHQDTQASAHAEIVQVTALGLRKDEQIGLDLHPTQPREQRAQLRLRRDALEDAHVRKADLLEMVSACAAKPTDPDELRPGQRERGKIRRTSSFINSSSWFEFFTTRKSVVTMSRAE